jgi:THO complex subunit 1
VLEHVLRVRQSVILSNENTDSDDIDDELNALLSVAMQCADGDTVVLLIQDMLEGVDISRAARLFALVEAHAGALAGALGEQPRALLMLLRMCIELMRRMSKSEHTVFCGRVLLFLAQVYPLTDRSGLNAKGDINLANVTVFEDEHAFNSASTTTAASSLTATAAAASHRDAADLRPIDYQFYKTFWSLQSQLRDPTSVLASADAWRSFETALDSVLAALSTQRVTVAAGGGGGGEDAAAHDDDADSFVKYLTSSSLLDLQLSDASFRRHVLLQMLIAFQTLLDHKRTDGSGGGAGGGAAATSQQSDQQPQQHALTSTQATHVAAFKKHALALLRDTPPHGEAFEAAVSRLLKREGGWTAWKSAGCPSFARDRESLKRKPMRAATASGGVAKRAAVSVAGDSAAVTLAVAKSNDQAMRAGKLPPTFDELVQPLRNDLIEFEDDVDFATDHVFAWRMLRSAAMSKLGLLSRFVGVTKASELFKVVDEDQKSREARAAQPQQSSDKPEDDGDKKAEEEGLDQDLPADATVAAANVAAAATPATNGVDDVEMVEPEERDETTARDETARDEGRESGEAEPEEIEPVEPVETNTAVSETPVEADIEEQAARDAATEPIDNETAATIDEEIGAL